MIDDIIYRDVNDNSLVKFCENNLTDNARIVIGVFQDTDGVWKVDSSNYAYLVKCYFEAQIVTKGQMNGKLDFIMRPSTNSIM